MRERILCYALRYHGEWNKIAKAIGRTLNGYVAECLRI